MSFNNNSGRSRWGSNNNSAPAARPPARNDDEAALAALLNEASARDEQRGGNKERNSYNNQHRQGPRRGDQQNSDSYNHYRRPGDNKRVVEDDEKDERGSGKRRRRRWNDRDEGQGGPDRWGGKSDADNATVDNDNDASEEPAENPNKIKANFGLSGALASDTQTGNARDGITLKFSEPPEARIPNTRWRLYVFRSKSSNVKPTTTNSDKKDDDLLDVYHISRQSAYLFGRERKVADIPVDHGSLSKQHCVLQYRSLPSKAALIGEAPKLQCKPYLMDLESTNGTFINGVRLDAARYYELRRGDVITLGASTREYVLLTEQSAKTGI